jgi:hypothetical protein
MSQPNQSDGTRTGRRRSLQTQELAIDHSCLLSLLLLNGGIYDFLDIVPMSRIAAVYRLRWLGRWQEWMFVSPWQCVYKFDPCHLLVRMGCSIDRNRFQSDKCNY